MTHWLVTGPVLYLAIGAILWFGLMVLKYQGGKDPFSYIFYQEFGTKMYCQPAPPGVMLGWMVFGWPIMLAIFSAVGVFGVAFALFMLTCEGIWKAAEGPEKAVAKWLTPKPAAPPPYPIIHEVAGLREAPVHVHDEDCPCDQCWEAWDERVARRQQEMRDS